MRSRSRSALSLLPYALDGRQRRAARRDVRVGSDRGRACCGPATASASGSARTPGVLLLLVLCSAAALLAARDRDRRSRVASGQPGDPTVHAPFYAPLRAKLLQLLFYNGRPPDQGSRSDRTNAHWGIGIPAVGGPNLDYSQRLGAPTRYPHDALFYHDGVCICGKRDTTTGCQENAIVYVALPDAKFDSAGHWQRATPDSTACVPVYLQLDLAQLPCYGAFSRSATQRRWLRPRRGRLLGTDSFTLSVPHPVATWCACT